MPMEETTKTRKVIVVGNPTDKFDIPFDYLAKKFVKVYQEGILLEALVDYDFITATRIQMLKGEVAAGQTIEIRRETSATARLVSFRDASVLTASDLDISALQSLHLSEEARDSGLWAEYAASVVREAAEAAAAVSVEASSEASLSAAAAEESAEESAEILASVEQLHRPYIFAGDYALGVNLPTFKHYTKYGAEFYHAINPPYQLSGDWAVDSTYLNLLGDAALRQQLATPAGSSIIGHGSGSVGSTLDQLSAGLGGVIGIQATAGENITAKLLAAIASGARRVRLPVGTFLFDNPLIIEPGFRGFVLEGAGILNTTLKATVEGQPSVIMARTSGSTASFYQSLRDLSIDGDGKATYFRNASAYATLEKVRSVNHVETNYHATGLVNLHLGCVFPVNPNGVICSNATVWCSHNANYFQGCYLHGGGPSGTVVRVNAANGLESVKNSFHHCTIENGKFLIEQGAYAVSIDDNYLEQVAIIASGNCDGLVITNNRGAEAQPYIHLNNVARTASIKIADNNISFDIYITVANREGAVDNVLDFYQFPEVVVQPNGRRQRPILINDVVACDSLKVQRVRVPGDVSSARVELIGIYAETPAQTTPAPVLVASLYVRASVSALDGYFIEEKSYYRRPPTGAGGVDPYRGFYWLATGYVEYPNTSGGTVGATERVALYQRNPGSLPVTYSVSANGPNSKRWDMHITGEATRAGYISTDLKLTQIS